MKQRLKDLRKVLGLNQSDFARHLGITQTSYSMLENGNRPLSERYIKVICATFRVSERWLHSGEGDMFLSVPLEADLVEVLHQLSPELQQILAHLAKALLEYDRENP